MAANCRYVRISLPISNNYSLFAALRNAFCIGSVVFSLCACSFFKLNADDNSNASQASVDALTLVDEQHYVVNRLYLDSESSLNSTVVTQQFAWLGSLDDRRSRSQQDLDLQSAYDLLRHDKVVEAQSLLQNILAEHADYQPAKVLYDAIVSSDENIDASHENGGKMEVAVGDSWQSLAQKFYGSPLQFYRLVRLNHAKASQELEPGQVITVPATVGIASQALDQRIDSANGLPALNSALKPAVKPQIPYSNRWLSR